MAFNITAQLQLRGPANIRQVISQLRQQFGNINVNINLKIAPSTVTGLRNINSQLDALIISLRTLNTISSTAGQSLGGLGAGVQKVRNPIASLAASLQKTTTSTSKLSKGLEDVDSAFFNLGKSAGQAIKRFAAFSTVTVAVFNILAAFKAGATAAVDFQDQLVRIAQVTGLPVSQLKELNIEVSRLATSLGVSSQKLLNVSQVLSQAGLSVNQVKIALDSLAKTDLAPTFTDIENTVEGAIAVMGQFGKTTEDLGEILSVFNSVSAKFAVESDDLVTAVRRGGSAFEAAGGSLNEYVALFTSVRSATREGAETIATGFRTIFTRLQRPKTLDFLKTIGIDLRNANGEFIGAYEAVRRLNKGLSQLSTTDPRFAQIIEELGGYRQITKVIPLVQQFGKSEEALNVAMKASASLNRDAETAQQSLKVQVTSLKEEFFKLFKLISEDTNMRFLIEGFLDLSKAAIQLTQSLVPLVAILPAVLATSSAPILKDIGGGILNTFGIGRRKAGASVSRQGLAGNLAFPTRNPFDALASASTPIPTSLERFNASNSGFGFRRHPGNAAVNFGLGQFTDPGIIYNPVSGRARRRGQFGHLPTNQAPIANLFTSPSNTSGTTSAEQFNNFFVPRRPVSPPVNNSLLAFQNAFPGQPAARQNFNPALRNRVANRNRINGLTNKIGLGAIVGSVLGQGLGADEDITSTIFGGGTGAIVGGQFAATDRRRRGQAIARLSRLGLSRGRSRAFIDRSNKALPFAGAAIGAGTVAGGNLADIGLEDIKAGRGSAKLIGGRALQSAGTGAGLGAALGGVLGPVGALAGAAIGGVSGALIGLTSASREAAKALIGAKFDESFKSLEKGLELIGQGTSTKGAQSGKIVSGIDNLLESLATTSGEQKQGILVRGEGQLSQFQALLKDITANITDISQIGVVGNKLVDVLSRLNNVTRTELIAGIQEEIDGRAKANAKNAETIKTQSEFIAILRDFNLFSEALTSFSDSVENSARGMSIFAGQLNSIEFGGFGALSQGRTNFAGFSNTAQGLFSNFGGPGKTLSEDFIAAQQIRNILPTVLSSVASVGALGTSPNASDEVSKRLVEALGIDEANPILKTLLGELEEFITDETGFNKFFDAIGEQGVQGFSEKLLQSLDPIQEAGQQAGDLFADILGGLFKNLETVVQQNIRQAELGVRGGELALNRDQAAFGFARQNFGGGAFDVAELGIRQGLLGGVANDPQAVVRALNDINSEINIRRQNLTGENLADGGNVLANAQNAGLALVDLETRAAKLTIALERMANPTEKLAVLNAELARLEKERLAKTDIFDVGVFGNLEERFELLTNIGNAAKAAQAGNIDSIPLAQRRGVQQILERFAEIGGPAAEGAKQVLDQLRAAQNGPAGVDGVGGLPGKQEMAIQDQIIATYNLAIAATNAQRLAVEANTTALLQGFDIDTLGSQLEAAFRNTQIEGLNVRRLEAEGQQGRLVNSKNSIAQLEQILGVDFTTLTNAVGQADQLKRLSELNNINNLIVGGGNRGKIEELAGLTGGNATSTAQIQDFLTETLGLGSLRFSNITGDLGDVNQSQRLALGEQLTTFLGPGNKVLIDSIVEGVSGISREATAAGGDAEKVGQFIADKIFGEEQKRSDERFVLNKELSDSFTSDLPRLLEIFGAGNAAVNIDAIKGTLEALGGQPAAQLDANIRNLSDSLFILNGQINALGGLPPAGIAKGGRLGFNMGGGVRPQGSDRVPGMMPDGQQLILQPGEYIVNAASTRKHAAILDQINNDRGGFANGGLLNQMFWPDNLPPELYEKLPNISDIVGMQIKTMSSLIHGDKGKRKGYAGGGSLADKLAFNPIGDFIRDTYRVQPGVRAASLAFDATSRYADNLAEIYRIKYSLSEQKRKLYYQNAPRYKTRPGETLEGLEATRNQAVSKLPQSQRQFLHTTGRSGVGNLKTLFPDIRDNTGNTIKYNEFQPTIYDKAFASRKNSQKDFIEKQKLRQFQAQKNITRLDRTTSRFATSSGFDYKTPAMQAVIDRQARAARAASTPGVKAFVPNLTLPPDVQRETFQGQVKLAREFAEKEAHKRFVIEQGRSNRARPLNERLGKAGFAKNEALRDRLKAEKEERRQRFLQQKGFRGNPRPSGGAIRVAGGGRLGGGGAARPSVSKGLTVNSHITNTGGNNSGNGTMSMNMEGLSQFSASFNASINNFVTNGRAIADAIGKIPSQIEIVGSIRPIEIIFNGAEVLQQLQPGLQQLITDKVNEGIARVMNDKFPKFGFTPYPNQAGGRV